MSGKGGAKAHLETAPREPKISGQASASVDEQVAAALGSAKLGKSILARAARNVAKAKEPPLEVVIAPKGVGRVTGWAVVCPVHGAMEVLAPSMSAAVGAAGDHLDIHHEGTGEIRKSKRPIRGRR